MRSFKPPLFLDRLFLSVVIVLMWGCDDNTPTQQPAINVDFCVDDCAQPTSSQKQTPNSIELKPSHGHNVIPAQKPGPRRIYTYINYACVLYTDGQKQCFGPAVDVDGEYNAAINISMLKHAPASSLDLKSGELHQFYFAQPGLRVQNTRGGNVHFAPNMTFTSATRFNDVTCGLGGTEAPYDRLSCFHTHGEYFLTERLKEMEGQRFKQFSLDGLQGSRGNAIICALKSDHSAVCFDYGDPQTRPGPFKRIEYNSEGYACALKFSGDMECWSNYRHEVKAPAGKFKALFTEYCGLRSDDKVVCWGGLTTEDNASPEHPVVVYDGAVRDFDLSRASNNHNNWCALTQEGTVKCSQF